LSNELVEEEMDTELKLDFGFALNRIDIKTRLRVVFDLLDWDIEGLILDCGCGVGPACKVLTDCGISVVGLDLDRKAVRIASLNIPTASFIVGDASKLPFSNDCFSRIICSAVLEHVPDDEGAMKEMQRTLKKAGEIVITTPIRRHSSSDVRFLRLVKKRFGHVREGYRMENIKSLTEEARLRIADVKLYWGPFHWFILSLFERIPSTAKSSMVQGMDSKKKPSIRKAIVSRVWRMLVRFLVQVSYVDSLPLPTALRFGMGVSFRKA
jgi:2-polyprenyl-3-methyl-5-hydroxy-6-metoxy-1,4-benzoquinol methylase